MDGRDFMRGYVKANAKAKSDGHRTHSPGPAPRPGPPRFMLNTESATRMGFPAVGAFRAPGGRAAAGGFCPWSTRDPPQLGYRRAEDRRRGNRV